MSKYIIDILTNEYKDFPITLDGEVFLEKTYDDKGVFSGYITTTVDKVLEMKTKTDGELEKLGWDKYKLILDSFD